jgi:putative ABC transport system permease protein
MKAWILAWRCVVRRPGFALAVVAILAFGIGANTAVFSLVDAVLLKPLPYPSADRLVTVMESSSSKSEPVSLIAPARLDDWNRMNRTFEAIGATYSENVTDTSGSEAERLAAHRVSPRYFAVFGTKPVVGRTFTPEEEVHGGPAAVVISDSVWARRYHREPAAVGRRLILGGAGFTIVGVMPAEFAPPSIDLWIPAQLGPELMRNRDARFYSGVGRVKPGIIIAEAQDDLVRVQRRLALEFPQTDKGWSVLVGDLKEFRIGEYRRALFFVFGAVILLLLIAVANVAALMLSQLQRRSREMAIRSSIGGTRMQVAAGVVREVALIAVAGLALGWVLAAWLVDLAGKTFIHLPRSSEVRLDWRALLFASLGGILAAMLSGLLPALQATRGNLGALLSSGGRGGSAVRHEWQSALVAGQVAITVLLMATAGLMARSYYNLSHVDLGFDPAHAITFHVGAAWDENRAAVGRMQKTILAQLERVPGVEAAGFANFLPATGAILRYQVTIDGLVQREGAGAITVGERSISRGYLRALGARLVAGEDCPDFDLDSAESAKALVSRGFAELHGRDRDLIGRHLQWADQAIGPPMELVGVVDSAREDTLQLAPAPYVYVCMAPGGWPDPEYVVRTHADVRALLHDINPIIHGIDPSRAVFGVQTLQNVLDTSLEQPRLNTGMLTLFALAGLMLASVGLYGLVSLVVVARTREIGVRMALGAGAGQIARHVAGGVIRLVLAGTAAGLLLTVLAHRMLESVLFGVSPVDVATLGIAVVTLAAVSALATVGPARRAAHVDPLEAIRTE